MSRKVIDARADSKGNITHVKIEGNRRRGVTYAQLAEKLAQIGVTENERNLNNKISRGGFTAAFLLQCLSAIGTTSLQVLD